MSTETEHQKETTRIFELETKVQELSDALSTERAHFVAMRGDRDMLQAELSGVRDSIVTLRGKLANARGWISANTSKPIHHLLASLQP